MLKYPRSFRLLMELVPFVIRHCADSALEIVGDSEGQEDV